MGTRKTMGLIISLAFVGVVMGTMDHFLRDTIYSIHSTKEDGVLTLTNSPHYIHKRVTLEKWNNLETQKWIVQDFQSLGRYHITPLLYNRTDNLMTYEFTKNVYSHKRQWKIHLINTQRYTVENPESGYCLANMGMHNQIEEQECNKKLPSSQIWKFRLLQK